MWHDIDPSSKLVLRADCLLVESQSGLPLSRIQYPFFFVIIIIIIIINFFFLAWNAFICNMVRVRNAASRSTQW